MRKNNRAIESAITAEKPYGRAVSALIAGERGEHDLFIVFNASAGTIRWKLPDAHDEWDGVFNTALGDPFLFVDSFKGSVDVPEWSVVVLQAEALYNK